MKINLIYNKIFNKIKMQNILIFKLNYHSNKQEKKLLK